MTNKKVLFTLFVVASISGVSAFAATGETLEDMCERKLNNDKSGLNDALCTAVTDLNQRLTTLENNAIDLMDNKIPSLENRTAHLEEQLSDMQAQNISLKTQVDEISALVDPQPEGSLPTVDIFLDGEQEFSVKYGKVFVTARAVSWYGEDGVTYMMDECHGESLDDLSCTMYYPVERDWYFVYDEDTNKYTYGDKAYSYLLTLTACNEFGCIEVDARPNYL